MENTLSDILIEVCCGSVDDAVEAAEGGADRIELNSSLFFGGLTPSLGSIVEAKKRLDIPVMVMIRPRGGGFCYTQAEMDVMLHDTRLALEYGADGIVFGILTEDGSIDVDRCRKILELVEDREVVFHRAFDVTPDPFEALELLIELGVTRILTSGQKRTVAEGVELIKKLIVHARNRIEILPGGGIQPFEVRGIIEQTGTKYIHLAAFQQRTDRSVQNRPFITFGGSLQPPENQYEIIDRKIIQSVSDSLGATSNDP
jgi:copper homeostasis protein